MALVPVVIVTAVLAVAGLFAFGAGSDRGNGQVDQEVAAVLAGIPQQGDTLGSPHAPITLRIYADLECPTVKRFVVSQLPAIIDTWVRSGSVRLEYRSLETDTLNEHTFFLQEVAALAAGRQARMWNFLLTFVHEQGLEYSGYATDSFLDGIATQVPGLDLKQWRFDREDARLTKRVALDVQTAHARGLRSTPALLVGITSGEVAKPVFVGNVSTLKRKVAASLRRDVTSLREEATRDNPVLRSADLAGRKEVEEFLGK
jgi:protein-disulfide isomerase